MGRGKKRDTCKSPGNNTWEKGGKEWGGGGGGGKRVQSGAAAMYVWPIRLPSRDCYG